VFPKDCEEAIIVRRLNEMNHLVNDHVFEEILRLRYRGSTGLRGTLAVAALGIEFDTTKHLCPGSRTVRPDRSY
jgi:hypothetical protein